LAATAPVRVRFGEAGPTFEPAGGGVEGAIAALVIRVAEAMREGSWSRLKTCPADRCLATFYDFSRNRTATWCDMAVCGNREKVRSYQERRRRRTEP
jgi:predicted RNA-binding Zn ribbon-like protein